MQTISMSETQKDRTMKTLKLGSLPWNKYYLSLGYHRDGEATYWRVRSGLQNSGPTYFPTPEAAIAAAEAEGWTVEL